MLHDIKASAEQLRKIADWVLSTAAGGAEVELLIDGPMLIAEQGDDRMAWDTNGRPAGREYLDRCPVDRLPGDTITRESVIEALRDAHRNDSAADAVEYVSLLVGWSACDDPEFADRDQRYVP